MPPYHVTVDASSLPNDGRNGCPTAERHGTLKGDGGGALPAITLTPYPFPLMTTLHAYVEYLHDGGRLAATVWPRGSAADAVAATLQRDPDAVVLRVADWNGRYVAIGYAPCGIGLV